MDDGKRKLAIGLVLGSLALSIFCIVALATAKPSSFSCSGATKSCTWVHTNAIGLTSTDTYPLWELEESHIVESHSKHGTSYAWHIRATAGFPFTTYVMGEGNRDFYRVTIWTYNTPLASWKVPVGWGNRNEDVDRMREVLAS